MSVSDMDSAADGRRPPSYLLVAGVLLVVLAVLMAGALLLDQRLRPHIGLESVSVQPSAPSSVTASASPQASPVVSAVASAAAVGNSPSASSSTPDQQILGAYQHYWDVRTEAYLNLDTSHLPEVMAGAELSREQQQITDFKNQGRAARLMVQNKPVIVSMNADTAVVYDEYVNQSLFVDVVTKKDIPTSSAPATKKISYQMQKVDGTWKVVDGAQHD